MSRRQKKGAYVPQYWSTYVATPPHRVEPSSLLPESLLSAATIVTITTATTTSTPSYGIIYTHKSHGFPISQAPYIGLVLLYQISLRFLLASVCCAYLSHPPPLLRPPNVSTCTHRIFSVPVPSALPFQPLPCAVFLKYYFGLCAPRVFQPCNTLHHRLLHNFSHEKPTFSDPRAIAPVN